MPITTTTDDRRAVRTLTTAARQARSETVLVGVKELDRVLRLLNRVGVR